MKLEDEIKQKTFSSPYQKLILNVFVTSSWFSSESARVLKPHKITMQQYNVLRILRGQQGKPASVGLIQERMLDKNSNASRLIDKLVLKKLVDRKPCPSDRRQMDIKITQKGLELLSVLDAPMQLLDREMAERLSEEEALKVSDILDRVRG
jgi:DNA-binding MarR family transcriptional regulator